MVQEKFADVLVVEFNFAVWSTEESGFVGFGMGKI
jgi:hypothetical protein